MMLTLFGFFIFYLIIGIILASLSTISLNDDKYLDKYGDKLDLKTIEHYNNLKKNWNERPVLCFTMMVFLLPISLVNFILSLFYTLIFKRSDK